MWTAVIVGSLGCYLLKLAGLSVPKRLLDNPRVERIADVLPISLLVALTATQAFGSGDRLVLDARAVGVVVAGVALYFRAPFLVVVALAATAAAVVRAVGM